MPVSQLSWAWEICGRARWVAASRKTQVTHCGFDCVHRARRCTATRTVLAIRDASSQMMRPGHMDSQGWRELGKAPAWPRGHATARSYARCSLDDGGRER